MRLLIDQNISYRVIARLTSGFQSISHVKDVGLMNNSDFAIFEYARQKGFDAIVTQDDDFLKIVRQEGIPPKIIWIRTGNATISFLADKLSQNQSIIESFLEESTLDCLEIY
ncbi:MAG: DUF5615 family PIN-like protein [Bacteroidia bacterium]